VPDTVEVGLSALEGDALEEPDADAAEAVADGDAEADAEKELEDVPLALEDDV
jgi:hypothetical protein